MRRRRSKGTAGRGRWRAAFAVAALVASGLPAATVQDREIGSRLQPRRVVTQQYDLPSANQMARQYVGCLAHQRRQAARSFLDAQDAQLARQAEHVLTHDVGSCNVLGAGSLSTGAAMRLPTGVLRGFLAEALLLDEPAHAVAEPLRRAYAVPWLAASGRNEVVEEMATCVAAPHPVEVRALFATTVATPAEAQALSVLQPAFGPCLAANARVSATALGLRTAFAEELYHREAAPVTPATP